jgi:hypothetical protein
MFRAIEPQIGEREVSVSLSTTREREKKKQIHELCKNAIGKV